MALTNPQLATYLLEVREVVQLMLGRFDEILSISERWAEAKESQDKQLADWQAGAGFDDDTWRKTMWIRGKYQEKYFNAVEGFLAGWARLSLLLFPIEGQDSLVAFRLERGRRIRETLGVVPDSILADRELRDSWMHFDERLDRAIAEGTFVERHQFLRSSEAGPFTDKTVALLEVDSLVVRYSTRRGQQAAMDLRVLRRALIDVREALKRTTTG